MPVMSDVFGLLMSAVGKLFSVVVGFNLEFEDGCFCCLRMLLLLSLDSAACGLE